MNLKRLSVWISAFALTGAVCTLSASATVIVDKVGPTYEGEYFIAYNDRLSYADRRNSASGIIPVAAARTTYLENRGADAPEPDSALSHHNIINSFTDEDGRTLYQIEPRNLEQVKPPMETFSLYDMRANSVLELGDESAFVTVDMNTNASQRTHFVLKYSGEHCNIWLEAGDTRGITDEIVSELGMEYDFYIHDRMENAFGPVYDRNGDGKMAILLYDIQDEYSLDPSGGVYTGGFFNAADLLTEDYNRMDVLHIDTYPSIPSDGSLDNVKSTMVHELQHLIECSAQMEAISREDPGEFIVKYGSLPTWIDEGLAMAAEHMLYGVQKDRIDYYNSNKYWSGIPLAEWEYGNSLSHYSLSYLFIQYLRTQTKDYPGGGEELYWKIIHSENRGDRCIETAMRPFCPNISQSDILLNFYIALTLNEDSGFYGFAGEEDFKDIKPCLQTRTNTSSWLGGGGAVVSCPGRGSYTAPSGAASHIRFAAFRLADEGEELPVEMPTADAASGEIYRFKSVGLYCREPRSTIYYTVDGTDPTPETGIAYTGRPIMFLSTTELRAVTVAADGRQSEIASWKYTVRKDNFEFYRRTVGNKENNDDVTSGGVVLAPDGGYIQVGTIKDRAVVGAGDFYDMACYPNRPTNGYSTVGWIAKYTAAGKQVWIKPLCSGENTSILSAAAADDGFVVAGEAYWGDKDDRGASSSYDFIHALTPRDESPEELELACSHSAYLAKYDWDGNLRWVSALPFIAIENPKSWKSSRCFNDVVSLRDDSGAVCGYVAAGTTFDPAGSDSDHTKGLIARFDTDGNLIWQNVLQGCENSRGGYFRTLAVSHDGRSVTAAGEFAPYSFGKENGRDWADVKLPGSSIKGHYPIAASYDVEDGSLQWANAYDFDFTWYEANGWITDILALEDGDYIAAGFDNQHGSTSEYKIHALRIDAEGNKVWLTTEHTGVGFVPAISLAEDGVMLVHTVGVKSGGKTWLSKHKLSPISKNYEDILALKYDLNGKFVWAKNYLPSYLADINNGDAYQINNVVRLSDRKFLVCATRGIQDKDTTIRAHGVLFTFYDESLPHYTVSGVIVTEEGTPVPGVSVSYTLADDPQEHVVLTDSQGNYSFKAPKGSGVTLIPQMEGYTFTSSVTGGDSDTLEPVTAASSGHDFTAEIVRYTISGTVTGLEGQGLSGIQVGPLPEDVTGESGTYSIQVRVGATLSLVPASEEPDVTFEPACRVLPLIREDISRQDFRVLPSQYTVSGKVTREDGEGQGGVLVGGVLTAPDGTYSITVDSGTSLKLTPKFPQYVFSPVDYELEDISADMPDQDFVMQLWEEPAFRLEADPSPVEFEALTEGYAQPQAATVTVTNVEGDPCVGVEAFLGEDSPFVLTPITRDTLVVGDGGATFTVRPKAGLAKGEYTAQVQIRQGETVLLTVPVSFAVKEKSTPQEPDKPTTPPTPPASSGSDDTPRPAPKPEPEPVYLDHLPYIVGYPDGTFRTENDLTRGQCAAILARLSEAFDPEKTYPQGFSDVPGSRWYADSIGFLTAKKVIRGYPDGTFRPDAPITRAEFVTLLCNVLRPEDPAENPFPDAEGHWAVYYIARLTQAGVLDGYPDGTFRPDAPITRAEAVKSVNRAYDRSETVPQFKAEESPFSDLENTYWAYYEILEASIRHRVQK